MYFFKKTDKSHDATKRVRKAASGDASDQEEEASPATGDLVHSPPEWGADTAHPISHHVDPHQQPEQEASMEISASQVQQQEAGTTTSTRFFHEASEGEERALSGEECGSSSDRSGGCATVWTAAQFKVKQSYYPWLLMDSSGLGCTICKTVGTLGPEKTGGMKLAKEWVSNRPGRYTVLSQRGIEENSFQGITLNEGKSSDKTLDAKPFFQAVAKNLENRMLSQGGRVPDKTGYNKFIEELKVLYAQYWPEDAGRCSVPSSLVKLALPPKCAQANEAARPAGSSLFVC
uniref:Uncharacterized protein n=1 Tax=Knipowitschia caucasica TaxID=637954 RepID=A0AAV2K7M1_KNICA